MHNFKWALVLPALFYWPALAFAQALPPVTEQDFGLKIVQFDVGQADAAALVTRDGHCAVIDLGQTNAHGTTICEYLSSQQQNGVQDFESIDLLFVSHYDQDHIGGAKLVSECLNVREAFDQGPSRRRSVTAPQGGVSAYGKYVELVGDPNGNGVQDGGEDSFVRHRAEYGQSFTLGNDTELIILSVRGDTRGNEFDIDRDPSNSSGTRYDENPGSIIMLVRLGKFEFLTGGDATCDDWVGKPDTENNVIRAEAIPGGPDIDVLKVSHHGSDTSSGRLYIESTQPEVGIISSTVRSASYIPKETSLMMLTSIGAVALVTGAPTDAEGNYVESSTAEELPVEITESLVHGEQGNITILVSQDGSRYTVKTTPADGPAQEWTFSSSDEDNPHPLLLSPSRFVMFEGAEPRQDTQELLADAFPPRSSDPVSPPPPACHVDLKFPDKLVIEVQPLPGPARDEPTSVLAWIERLVPLLLWPITVILVAVMFKREISALSTRLERLKYKDFEAIFALEVERLKARAPKTAVHAATVRADSPLLVDRSPRDAIIQATLSVDQAAADAIGRRTQPLDEAHRNALIDLRLISDTVRKLPELQVTKDQALTVLQIAAELEAELKTDGTLP